MFRCLPRFSRVAPRILEQHAELTAWRHDFHRHPELGFQEHRTSRLVSTRLASFGLEVSDGIGGTGVIGTLQRGSSEKSIGLRADMDALPILEQGTLAYRSETPGIFHGCGHDGHTTMLLGCAKHLAAHGEFNGTVQFIFQPSEEENAGAKAMVEDGLFDRFPCDEVYGLHNWPGLEEGEVAVFPGPMMAGSDEFDIRVIGSGGHAAMPHQGVDPIVVGSILVSALQSIVSRTIDPTDSAVVSVTKFQAGSAHNVIADEALLSGTLRSLNQTTRVALQTRLRDISNAVASAHGAKVEVSILAGGYPATVNNAECAEWAAQAAEKVVGRGHVSRSGDPSMGSEDFSFLLMERPGAYAWLGAGGGPLACMLHNPSYDFNDDIIPVGVQFLTKIVEDRLPLAA
mmetsp:Transcript_54315/g.74208  ORF Transcript_54315/g.74208 Transcript_54315/m.74208 type:complete len:400 (-) Transcript_54315:503-1702(-)|eukprot:CAMPEP_0185748888 /NCGR_PEP_ID=MMETSP1174-20130828/7607_1 /TAXON_ID=35687 /ORGANISM="Dictyocha speculum, Strain CCMP1381" /LENGTH=399 /DNA_ID=CAMNT_0028424771 /DNA_START=58 /DNA_END=1257 /DNA_ORIENTATION=-